MDLRLDKKIALVLASSKGLGFECALALVKENCDVIICSRNKERLERAAKEIRAFSSVKVLPVVVDLENEQCIHSMNTHIKNKIGFPDILVANTGGPPIGGFMETSEDLYGKWIKIGILNIIQIIRACIPSMKEKKWGRIISIGSITVKQPIDNLILSNMYRAGLVGFLKSITSELGQYGITVNSLLPGMHSTARLKEIMNNNNEAYIKNSLKNIPLGKFGKPSNFGAIAAFLASEQAAFITGQSLLVDGGEYRGM